LRINAIVDDHIAVAVALVFAKLSNSLHGSLLRWLARAQYPTYWRLLKFDYLF
jgi:hypothetical protein